MFKVIHGMELDYFPTKEIAMTYYKSKGMEYEGLVNILSLDKTNSDTVYAGAYGSPYQWTEYSYSESQDELVCVRGE